MIHSVNTIGKPSIYKTGHNLGKREKSPSWKGGRIYDFFGYILILKPEHPFATKDGYVREHRLVMEQHIGRYLEQKEEIHHKNGKKDDNRIENLQLMTHREHSRHHFAERVIVYNRHSKTYQMRKRI